MDNKGSIFNFIFWGGLGIFLFFIPVHNGEVPMVFTVNTFKNILDKSLSYIVLISCTFLLITYILAKLFKVKAFISYHERDSLLFGISFILAFIFDVMVLIKKGPYYILNPNVGSLAVGIAETVFLTVSIAGWFVVFLVKTGPVEFVGTIMEPLMRPIYLLPGEASINDVASFVSAPAVGVYITDQLYLQGKYTIREAVTVMTNFSVCSLGFFGLLVSIVGKVELYPYVVISSFIIVFIMGAIVVRIWPLSKRPNVYVDGRKLTVEDIQKEKERSKGNIIARAFNRGIMAAGQFNPKKDIILGLFDALKFAQKIVAYVIAFATIALFLAEYTPLFIWLGKPMIPYLKILGMPNAEEIAPSTLIGIAEIALPPALIAGKDIALKSIYFIIVLTSVQIIFFSESAQAMLQCHLRFTVLELVIIFLERTIIAMPIIALFAHILFK